MVQLLSTWKAVRLTRGTAPASFSRERLAGTGARWFSFTYVYSAQAPVSQWGIQVLEIRVLKAAQHLDCGSEAGGFELSCGLTVRVVTVECRRQGKHLVI